MCLFVFVYVCEFVSLFCLSLCVCVCVSYLAHLRPLKTEALPPTAGGGCGGVQLQPAEEKMSNAP